MLYGLIQVLSAYLMWGLFPLYFNELLSVSALEILSHRIVWSVVFAIVVLIATIGLGWLRDILHKPKTLLYFAVSSILIAVNWGTYIWAVTHNMIIDASLGYFINPLITVLLGALILKERLRIGQWGCIALAFFAVAYLTYCRGHLPLISLVLACSFGLYGLVRKTAPLGSLQGFTLESLFLMPLALVYMGYLAYNQNLVFLHAPEHINWLLIAAGPITAIPLLLFAAGARKIPYSVLGITQYSSPSIQFLLGVFFFHESFGQEQLITFSLIWTAVALFTVESIRWYQQIKSKKSST